MTVGRHDGAAIPAQGTDRQGLVRSGQRAGPCRKENWPVSNRLLVFIIPAVVVLAFCADGRVRAARVADLTHTGFVSATVRLCRCSSSWRWRFWTLFLVMLPYLYMVQECFHPTLWPKDRGGPKDILTLEQYQFFIYGSDGLGNFTHLRAFLHHHRRQSVRHHRQFRPSAIRLPTTWRNRAPRRRCACCCWR